MTDPTEQPRGRAQITDARLKWEEADLDEQSYRLLVPVELGSVFLRNEFAGIAERRNQEARGEPWGSIDWPAAEIVVRDVQAVPGVHDQLCKALEKMFDVAKERALQAWERSETKRKEKQQQDQARAEKAQEMQEEFRRFGS